MATKTLSVDDEAYERLRRARLHPKESFSKVIKRAKWETGRPRCGEILRRSRVEVRTPNLATCSSGSADGLLLRLLPSGIARIHRGVMKGARLRSSLLVFVMASALVAAGCRRHPSKEDFLRGLMLPSNGEILRHEAEPPVFRMAPQFSLIRCRDVEDLRAYMRSHDLVGGWNFHVVVVETQDRRNLPSEGKELLVIGRTEDGLHLRAFDPGGRRVIDWNEADDPGQREAVASFKRKLPQVRETTELSRAEQNELIAAVETITGHTRGWIRGRYTEGVTNTIHSLARHFNLPAHELPDLSIRTLYWRTSALGPLFDRPSTYAYLAVADEGRGLLWIMSAPDR
jgi:hypothetical protein